jgi:hypothetical protein
MRFAIWYEDCFRSEEKICCGRGREPIDAGFFDSFLRTQAFAAYFEREKVG